MKVMSISMTPSPVTAFKPSQHFTRLRALPCEVVECYDAASVYEHGESADVILLPGTSTSWPTFWNEVARYVEQLPAFVAIFRIDSYVTVWRPGRTKIRFDALLPLQYTAYNDHAAELGYDCEHVFWSPCCVDVQDHGIAKDIQVFFWGNPGATSYPFRNFILRELTRYSHLEKLEGELIRNTLLFGEADYGYARLPYHNVGYWGYSLYPLLERAKICCTGSMTCRAPHPKYFENAACGCVTMTNEFSDREALGFIHRKNIWVTDEENFIKDLLFLLTNEDLVAEMSANARQLISDRHSVDMRATELYDFLMGRQAEG